MARPRTITQTLVVQAKPADVYDAFMNPRKHAAFTGGAATGSRRIGGAFTACDGYIRGVNRQLSPGKKIVQDWRTTEWPDGAPDSRVELTFRAVKGATQLRMVHSNVPAEQADRYRQGWIDYYWTPLQSYFSK